MASGRNQASTGYFHCDAEHDHTHAYLMPVVRRELDRLPPVDRVFDLGCGNGSLANWLHSQGYAVSGVDPSESGIAHAQSAYPNLGLRKGSCYDDLAATFGTYPVVISLEVIEHLYNPRLFAACIFDLLDSGGHALISTPYHGYLKNVVLAASGKLDAHFTALWDHGHIKFWSPLTLRALLTEAGFDVLRIHRVGRIPVFAKSMLIVARKP